MERKEQFIHINEYGNKHYYSDREMTFLHREDGPAVEYADGYKEWRLNGKLHREDGPAVEYANGDKVWRLNGKLHREDGPAIEFADGDKEWYIDDKRHREDGPAVECADGDKAWYIDGKRLTEEEFNARTKPPTHFRPTNDNISACGIVHPQYAAYDGRDVNCLSCRKTKAWKTYMGQNAKRIR